MRLTLYNQDGEGVRGGGLNGSKDHNGPQILPN